MKKINHMSVLGHHRGVKLEMVFFSNYTEHNMNLKMKETRRN